MWPLNVGVLTPRPHTHMLKLRCRLSLHCSFTQTTAAFCRGVSSTVSGRLLWLLEDAESHSWANLFRKQKVHKTALLLQSFARSQGKQEGKWHRRFSHNGSFYYHPFPLVSSLFWRKLQQRRIRGISNQLGRARKAAPFHYGQVFSAWERNFVLSPYSITNTHKIKIKNRQQLRTVLEDIAFGTHTHTTGTAAGDICGAGRIKADTGNLQSVISRARQHQTATRGEGAESFDKTSLFSSSGLFQPPIKKLLW